MKIRIKFSKEGKMRFIGHLDFMRFFQKVIRRADIDIKFSEGISPHMIMSFASPLGVGVSGAGEYVDIEVNTSFTTDEALARLNGCSVEDVRFLDYRRIPDGKAGKGMSIVAAADYEVGYAPGYGPEGDWTEDFLQFMDQDQIMVTREKKKAVKKAAGRKKRHKEKGERISDKETAAQGHEPPKDDTIQILDIKPLIYIAEPCRQIREETAGNKEACEREDGRPGMRLRLSSGSSANLRPDLVMRAYTEWRGEEWTPFAFRIRRIDLLCRREDAEQEAGESTTDSSGRFVSLGSTGERIQDESD